MTLRPAKAIKGANRMLKVVQCDQTFVLAASIMMGSEEARRPYKSQSSFLLLQVKSEVQHGNRIDCSFGAVFARWRGLGILSLARLARSQDERVNMLLMLLDGIHAICDQSSECADSRANPLSGFLN